MKVPSLPAAALAATAAAGLLAGCGTPAAGPDAASPGPSATRTATAMPTAAPTLGLRPASPLLTTRLVLTRTTATAGTPIRGVLVVTYRGSRALNLTRQCRPQFAVILTNSAFPPEAAFPLVCSLEPFLVKPGENRLPFTVSTSYPRCSQTGSAADGTPPCGSGTALMPPLPAGHYRAVLVGDALALPAPAAVPVTLTAPPGG